MKVLVSLHVHSSWQPIFEPLKAAIEEIIRTIEDEELAPSRELIFKAFETDLNLIRCVVIGQDPYPTAGNAMGLAFSVPPTVKKIPASLKNIFLELHSDEGVPIPVCGDLSSWTEQGVLLLNRVLTTRVGVSNAHAESGWKDVTEYVARELGRRNVVAILWGRQAQELSSHFHLKVEGVHPSPLSAYKGFFGSKPFSQVNEHLIASGREPIDWTL